MQLVNVEGFSCELPIRSNQKVLCSRPVAGTFFLLFCRMVGGLCIWYRIRARASLAAHAESHQRQLLFVALRFGQSPKHRISAPAATAIY
jgi:hypothetical protein